MTHMIHMTESSRFWEITELDYRRYFNLKQFSTEWYFFYHQRNCHENFLVSNEQLSGSMPITVLAHFLFLLILGEWSCISSDQVLWDRYRVRGISQVDILDIWQMTSSLSEAKDTRMMRCHSLCIRLRYIAHLMCTLRRDSQMKNSSAVMQALIFLVVFPIENIILNFRACNHIS